MRPLVVRGLSRPVLRQDRRGNHVARSVSTLIADYGCPEERLISPRSFFQQTHRRPTFSYLRKQQQQQQIRQISWLPDFMQTGFSIWGASGYLLQNWHELTGLPYWACFASLSIAVRTLLVPVVLYGAHTSARFAKIVPDVQFQLALFQRDIKHYRSLEATIPQMMVLFRTNLQTLSHTYKLYNIRPWSVFLSPLLQMPIFWYVSVDMRKITNGLDPILAQNLVDSTPLLWMTDLTEPDPWFGLPILAGILLYANVEVALGKQILAGKAASKATTAVLLKDGFQSLAVFMPCFTSQLASGVQVYVCTSFLFTALQSIALRNETFREMVGLPSMLARPDPSTSGKYAQQMIKLKELEFKAKELRGDGPVMGKDGVLMRGWEISFAGTYQQSTLPAASRSKNGEIATKREEPPVPFVIQTLANAPEFSMDTMAKLTNPATFGPYVPGVSAPPWQVEQQMKESLQNEDKDADPATTTEQSPAIRAMATDPSTKQDDREYLPQFSDEEMERANRGELPRDAQQIVEPTKKVPSKPINVAKLRRQKRNKRSKR